MKTLSTTFIEPLIFTHQGAYWIPTMDQAFRMPLHSTYGEYVRCHDEQIDRPDFDLKQYDPQAMFGKEYFENCLREAAAVAEERGAALYCGEFGVIDRAAPEDILDWYKMICGCFDRYGIGRAAWSYRKMDFGIADKRMDSIRSELLRVL